MRPVEIRSLRWKDIDWIHRTLTITVSKTPEGWRTPSLNTTCLTVLQSLYAKAQLLGMDEPDHFVFPYHATLREGIQR